MQILQTQVHALNILRGLINDASLGEEILPYISQCMQESILGTLQNKTVQSPLLVGIIGKFP